MESTNQQKDYLPIEDHGIIGNLVTCALVGLDGRIDFMCYPKYDSPTIFAGLLDKDKGGEFTLCPCEKNFNSKQMYYPNTNILMTRFMEDGITEITDFMPIKEGRPIKALIRKVDAINGASKIKYSIAPKFDYGRETPEIEKKDEYWEIKSGEDKSKTIKLFTNVDLRWEKGKAKGEALVQENQPVFFALIDPDCEQFQSVEMDDIMELFNETRGFWNEWVSQAKYQGKWQQEVLRSALTLKLLLPFYHGSLVAAPTFGLPEAIGGERNWDYRYTWVRDTSYTLYALSRLGFTEEAEDYLDWVNKNCKVFSEPIQPEKEEQEPLEIMYRIDGSVEDLQETSLDHLEGYKGSSPTRVGNEAYKQKQIEIFGEFLDMLYIVNKDITPIGHEMWMNVLEITDWLENHWGDKGHGIWEIRSEPKVHMYSILMSWVAFDRAIKISHHNSLPGRDDHWQNIRDKIYHVIHEEFFNKDIQSFVQYKDTNVVDASLLRMPIVDFISSTDPRWLSTLKKIEAELVNDTLVDRYNLDNPDMDDGLAGHEGSFVICSFWYIENLARSGQTEKARLMFEKILSYGNHLGLFSEELSLRGEHLGNFPQALSHLSLINTAINLDAILNQERKTKNPMQTFRV